VEPDENPDLKLLVKLIPFFAVIAALFAIWALKGCLQPKSGAVDIASLSEQMKKTEQLRESLAAQQLASRPAAPVRVLAPEEIRQGGAMAFYGQQQPVAQQFAAAPAQTTASAQSVEAELKKVISACLRGDGIIESAVAMAHNAALLKAFLNNGAIVKLFMRRFESEGLLLNPRSLATYAQNSAELKTVLESSAVMQALGNKSLVDAVCNSRLVNALATTVSMKALSRDPSLLIGLMRANPKLVWLMANGNVRNALMANPNRAQLAKTAMSAGGAQAFQLMPAKLLTR
jgi:hypothetical protein